jgi:hypothetical protein
MKKFILLPIIASIIFISCQQEVPLEILNQVKQCKIVMGHYYGGGGINDSASFIYNASGKIVKWQGNDGYYDYFYSGDNIVLETFKENGTNDLWWLDSIRYNANNTISEIIFYDLSLQASSDTIHSKVIFEYQNNQVSRLIDVDYYDYGFGPQNDTGYTNIFWSAGNIEKMVFLDAYGIAYDSISYQYNSDPNYFKLVHPHFFLFDPEFELHAGFDPHLAYFYSKNNVTSFRIYSYSDYPVTYGIDSLNHVTEVNMGGFEYMKYKYQCP